MWRHTQTFTECQTKASGARFFNVAAQLSNLSPKQFRSVVITAGDRNGKSELQLFQLVTTFKKAATVSWHGQT